MIQQHERCEGEWHGQEMSFDRIWGGYRFSDQECQALFDGATIEITGLISKNGKPYGVAGKLSHHAFSNHVVFGFEPVGFL